MFDAAMGVGKARFRVTWHKLLATLCQSQQPDLLHASISWDGFLAILGGGRSNSTNLIQLLALGMVAKIWIWGEESKVVTKPKSIDALATTAA